MSSELYVSCYRLNLEEKMHLKKRQQADAKAFELGISIFTAVLFSSGDCSSRNSQHKIPIQFNMPSIEIPINNSYLIDEKTHFETNKALLVKANSDTPASSSGGSYKPNGFSTPPAGGRPSRHVYIPPYRTAPKLIDQGLGAGANPAGAGGGGGAARFDDQCPVPLNQDQDQELKTYNYQSKKKKQSAEQCELDENVTDGKIEIVYRIKENPALIREAERMGKDQAAQKDVNNLIEQLSLGNDNPGIGNRRVKGLKNVSEARGRNEGRVYYREKDGKIEILAKSNKDNQNKVLGILKKMGY